LFRYQRFNEWLERILVDNELYFPIRAQLNDPCEFSYEMDLTWNDRIQRKSLELLRSQPAGSTAVSQANPGMDMAAIEKIMREAPFEDVLAILKTGHARMSQADKLNLFESQIRLDGLTIGLCSFSELSASSYMSYSYADRHTGVCLEFSTSDPPFSNARHVTYQSTPPTVHLASVGPGPINSDRALVKSLEWEQEREWRLINHRIDDGEVMKFPSHALVSIALCPNFQPTDLSALKSMIAKRSMQKLPPIRVFRLIRAQHSYELVRELVTDNLI
jgi:hypothetical protein